MQKLVIDWFKWCSWKLNILANIYKVNNKNSKAYTSFRYSLSIERKKWSKLTSNIIEILRGRGRVAWNTIK